MKRIILIMMVVVFGTYGLAYGATKKNGVVKDHFDSGELMSETTYENGKRHGITKMYNKKGKVVTKKKYENGKQISQSSYESDFNWDGVNRSLMVKVGVGFLIFGGLMWFFFIKVVFRNRPI